MIEDKATEKFKKRAQKLGLIVNAGADKSKSVSKKTLSCAARRRQKVAGRATSGQRRTVDSRAARRGQTLAHLQCAPDCSSVPDVARLATFFGPLRGQQDDFLDTL